MDTSIKKDFTLNDINSNSDHNKLISDTRSTMNNNHICISSASSDNKNTIGNIIAELFGQQWDNMLNNLRENLDKDKDKNNEAISNNVSTSNSESNNDKEYLDIETISVDTPFPEIAHDPSVYDVPISFNMNHFNSNSPSFEFQSTKCLDFDLKNGTYMDLFEQIKIFKGYFFNFHTKYDNYSAFGIGATKQVYQKLVTDMIGDILIKTSSYFMDINVINHFWQIDSNIEAFVIFIGMLINSGCVLPYHLAPGLLESIINKKMNIKEMEFFMEKIDPVMLGSVKKIHPADFHLLETNYDTVEDLYRSILGCNCIVDKINIYKKIANNFELFDSFHDYNILTIDQTLSGLYTITADRVLSMIYMADPAYTNSWENFVRSLSESELKQMLITFGNTLSIDNKYTIYVSDTLKTDIHITTCIQSITINKKLLDNIENLNQLKCYFMDSDQISDATNTFLAYDDNLHTQQSEGSYIRSYNNIFYRQLPGRSIRSIRSIVPENDEPIWRRLRIIPFTSRFNDDSDAEDNSYIEPFPYIPESNWPTLRRLLRSVSHDYSTGLATLENMRSIPRNITIRAHKDIQFNKKKTKKNSNSIMQRQNRIINYLPKNNKHKKSYR